jgi:Bifunctional DNA primase/polymerase, N-terminal
LTHIRNFDLHEAADEYIARNWSLLVLNGKIPVGSWGKPWTTDRVHRSIDFPNATGLGVALGPRSGGLAVRDFDSEDAFWDWYESNEGIAELLPIANTLRGFHVYVVSNGTQTEFLGDGEIRGEGAYVVLPPSLRPDGGWYRWLTDFYSVIPEVPLEVILSGKACKHHSTQPQRSRHSVEPEPVFNNICPISSEFTYAFGEHVARCIAETIPAKYGQRTRCIWHLARRLRAELPVDTDVDYLVKIISAWHATALPTIKTKGFMAARIAFLSAWYAVQSPFGAGLNAIRGTAANDGYQAGLGNTNIDLVARVFRAASSANGNGPFRFDFRNLAACSGLGRQTVHRLVPKIINARLVEIVEPGKQWQYDEKGKLEKSGVATTWRWIGPQAEQRRLAI